MPAFPTLSIPPIFPLASEREDSTIKNKMESGYVVTRARFTKERKKWTVRYENLPASDMALLDAFETTVHVCADSFTWTHPASGTSFTVTFESPPKSQVTSWDGSQYLYSYDCVLVEV